MERGWGTQEFSKFVSDSYTGISVMCQEEEEEGQCGYSG
jgi:hypothetical protein